MRIISKLSSIIQFSLVYLQRKIYLLSLYHKREKGLIDDYHYFIKRLWVSKPRGSGIWNHFYQTHPKLDINGVRPTISRINNYKLLNYINNKSVILDIGCHTGFVSSYLSSFVQSIDAIEYNKDNFLIASKTIDYLKIINVNLFNIDIKKFQCKYKYDLVMSLAIHRWVGIGIDEYLVLLKTFKKDTGFLIIESHPNDEDKLSLKTALTNSRLKIVSEGITDDHLGRLRDFYILT